MLESKGTELEGRFIRAYSELLDLLSSDKLACEEIEGALPPLPADIQALRDLDQSQETAFYSNEREVPNENNHGEENDEAAALEAAMLARALELSLQEG